MSIGLLIADDHPVFREGLKLILGEAPDLRVVGEVADGHQAVARCESRDVDVLLLDLMMPGPGLPGILRDLRERRPRLPVVVLTALRHDRHASDAWSAGAAGYLTKEQAPRSIAETIRKVHQGERCFPPAVLEFPGCGANVHDDRFEEVVTVADLTAREAQVAALAIEGLGNRHIAHKLGISPITVGVHLTRVYRKTQVGGRTELTRLMSR